MSSALRELLAKFTVEVDTSAIAAGVAKVDTFAKKLTGFLDAISGKDGFGAKFKEISDDLKERSGEIGRASKMLGISAGEFQKLQYQSGASAETLSATFRTLQRNIGKAGAGAGEAGALFEGLGESTGDVLAPAKGLQDAFKKLNIDLKDGAGKAKPSIDVFGELAEKIGNTEDPSTRAALAMKFFGSQGMALLPYFRKSGEELKAAAKDFDELGGGISEHTIKAYKDLGVQGKRLALVQTSLYSAIAEHVIPIMAKKVEATVKVVSAFFKLQKNTNIVKASVLIFGAAMTWLGRESLIAGAKAAIAWAPMLLMFALLALIVDDVWTAMEGGDSVLGKIDTWLSGLNGGKNVFNDMGKDVRALHKDLDKIPTVGGKVEEAFSQIGASIVKFFVDDIPEAASFLWKDIKAGFWSFDDSARQVFKSIVSTVVNAVKDIGSYIGGGISGGIDAAWEAVSGSVKRLGERIKGAFADFFKAHSPSQVMIEDTQIMIGGGVAGGLIKSIPMVESAANDLYSTMLLPQPSLPVPSVSGNGPVRQSVQQSNRIDITVQGGPSDRDTASSVRDAILPTLNDNARATLAALEPSVDNG